MSAALIPPWAALECDRTGWTLEMMPTEAPPSAAARAARWPARPAPITRTSCWGIWDEAAAILGNVRTPTADGPSPGPGRGRGGGCGRFCTDMRCIRREAPLSDRRLAALAARQHGVVARRAAGGARARARARSRGGCAARPAAPNAPAACTPWATLSLPRNGRLMAAVLACGEGAVLSHRSAAELWGIGRRAAFVELT